jgi:hypothetical protein
MIRTRYLATGLALALALTACDSVEPLALAPDANMPGDSLEIILAEASGERSHRDGSSPTTGADPHERPSGGTGDDPHERPARVPLFDELAELIPGFGGLYRTRQCAVVLVLTAEADREEALYITRRKLAPLMERSCPHGYSLTAEAGEFTYLELRRYLSAAARPLMALRGVEAVRIDFQLNRLVIEVVSREVANRVVELLPELGVPVEAVAFQLAH